MSSEKRPTSRDRILLIAAAVRGTFAGLCHAVAAWCLDKLS